MRSRKIITKRIIDEYGDEVDSLDEVVDALLESYPNATDDEIVLFIVDYLVDYDGEISSTEELLDDFKGSWGSVV